MDVVNLAGYRNIGRKKIIQLNKINLVFGLISFITTIVCLILIPAFDDTIKLIFLLPLCYFVGCVFFIFKKTDFIGNIIFSGYSIQFVLFPLLVCFNRGIDFTKYNLNVISYFSEAILLQCFVFLFCCLFILTKKRKKVNLESKIFNISKDKKKSKSAKILILIMVITSLLILFFYPQLLNKYRLVVFSSDEAYYTFLRLSNQVKETVPIFIYYFGFWIINTTKLILGYVIISYIWRKSYKCHSKFGVFLSLLITILLSIFTTEDKAATIFTGISYLILIYFLYPSERKNIKNISFGIVLISIIFIFIISSYSSNQSFTNYLVNKINAYFSCSINVSAVFLMNRENVLSCFCGDFLRSLPIIKGYFTEMPMSYIVFNTALGTDTLYNSQILPIISQGYYYFGILGAVSLPLLLINIIFNNYAKIGKGKDTFETFVYLIITTFSLFGLYLYDFALYFSLFMSYCFPLIVVLTVSKLIFSKS